MKRRSIRVGATLVVTGLCTAYILWKIDLGKTVDILRNADLGYFFAAVAIMVVTVWPMAWRWQKLLAGRGIHDRLAWLTRAYFTAYTAGQVLPTSVGGDAMRIFETTRRHPGNGGPIAGSVLLERALGGAATLALAAIGFVLAIGNYDVGAYLWVELGFVRRDRRPRGGAVLAADAAAARLDRAVPPAGCGSRSRYAPSTRGSMPTGPSRGCSSAFACSRSGSRRCACWRSG